MNSMRVRLVTVVAVMSAVLLFILSLFFCVIAKNMMIEEKQERLETQNIILKNYIISEDYMTTGESDIIDVEIAQLSAGYDAHIEIIDTSFAVICDSYSNDVGKVNIGSYVIRAMDGETVIEYDSKNSYVEFAVPVTSTYTETDDDGNETEVTYVAGVICARYPTYDIESMMSELRRYSCLIDVVAFIIILLVAMIASAGFVRPFKELEQSIEGISEGSFNEKINVRGYYEIEQISGAFNNLSDRLERQENLREEFVANVSHELKTPMASMKVLADSLLAQDGIPEEIYKEFLGDIVAEIDRENKTITDLLALVKMDKNSPMNIEAVNINEMLELILKRLRPLAAERNVELVLESFRPVVADIDETKFTTAISNLVENAIKYNKEDGWVRVSLNADQAYCYIKVSDSGCGIPQEDFDRVFDRFFRVDKARSRETGGTGLGLAITKGAVLAHHGSIKVHSKEGEGSTFTIRIPLKYAPQ